MPRFNLDDYETVEQRIKRFYADNPDGRIVTHNLTTPTDRSVATWIVRAEVYLSAGDQANSLPKATGLAFEVDGGAGANQTSALENAETSAIGRALANADYSGNKRASREEMSKVARGDWLEQAATLGTIEELRDLYTQARANNAPAEVLERLKGYADRFAESQNSGAARGVSDSSLQGKKTRN
jgi:hypothetical protein